ncbi:hypothetical protein GCM10010415_41820 [Streptomyces atrovirens]
MCGLTKRWETALDACFAMQSRCPVREVPDDGGDVGVRGADGYAEARGDLHEGVMPPEVDQSDESTPCGGSLQRRSLSRVTMSMVTHSTRA